MDYVFKEIVHQAKNQDMEAKEKILTSIKPLILSSMTKYAASYRDKEELFQEGCAHVLELIEEYDEERGVPFLGYVKIKLRYFYLNYSKKPKVILESLYQTIEGKESNKTVLMDLIEDKQPEPIESYLQKETLTELGQAMKKLTSKQLKIIELYYFKKMPLTDIAVIMEIHYMSAVKLKKRAIDTIRKELKIS